MAMTEKFNRLADKLEADAASIRSRIARASTSSQHTMRAEAAALERSARAIRAQVEEALRDEPVEPFDFWDPTAKHPTGAGETDHPAA